MHDHPSQTLRGLGKALRDQDQALAHEPLPRRWIDLIHHLNEREKAEREGWQHPMQPRVEPSK